MPISEARFVLVKNDPMKKLSIIAEKPNDDNETNMRNIFDAGKINPYFRITLTKNATKIIDTYVVMNQASQFTPGRKPIAFIVF